MGGEFEGWTYATTEQVEGLFASNGYAGPYNGSLLPGHLDEASAMLGLWGTIVPTTGLPGSSTVSAFILDVIPSPGAHLVGSVTMNYAATHGSFSTSALGLGDSGTRIDTGSALVRSTVVPVPAAVLLFGSGFIGLIGFSRRKKA